MASNLDLQEQEQLDELKAFWKQYGNLITWVVTLVLAGFAAWSGWQAWERNQAAKASAMYEEFDRALQAGDADRVGKVFGDLKDRFGRTVYAQQAGLLAAKLQAEKGAVDAAVASLQWVADHGKDEGLQAIARLRLASVLLDKKSYDEALKQVDAVKATEFAALADDRRGDILLASGKTADAVKAFTAAWKAMDERVDYRRIVEAKLTTLGAAPEAAASGVSQ